MSLKISIGFIFAILIALVFASPATGQFSSPVSPPPTPTHRPPPPWLRTPEPTPVPIIGDAVSIQRFTPTATIEATATTVGNAVISSEPTPIPIPANAFYGGSYLHKTGEQMKRIRGTK